MSVGHSCTVSFSEVHGDKSHEHIAEPNSFYVMTRNSQAYWQHRNDSNSSLPENYTRYSLTFRHVDKKFIKSTIISGDSNTRNLKFGSGKGTFGHNVPGSRAESIHISDITPSACYKTFLSTAALMTLSITDAVAKTRCSRSSMNFNPK